jgi:hypothetical protein
MKNVFERVNKELTALTSRRGFLRMAAKSVLGLAAAAVGGRAALQTALAKGPPNYCCTVIGNPAHACSGSYCPSGSTGQYSWYCCDCTSSFYKYRCQDCYDNVTGAEVCTAIFLTSMGGCCG